MRLGVGVPLVLIVDIFLLRLLVAVPLISLVKLFTDVPTQHQLRIIVQRPPAVVLVDIIILPNLNVFQTHAILLIQEPARVMLHQVLTHLALCLRFLVVR